MTEQAALDELADKIRDGWYVTKGWRCLDANMRAHRDFRDPFLFSQALQDPLVTKGTTLEIWQRAFKYGPANEPEARRLLNEAPANVARHCKEQDRKEESLRFGNFIIEDGDISGTVNATRVR